MLKSFKARVLLAEFLATILFMVLAGTGWLPVKDNPDTEENEAIQFIVTIIITIWGGGTGYIVAQGYADGKSGGKTSGFANAMKTVGVILCFGLAIGTMGCAAPAGVLLAADHMDQSVGSMANQYATMITLTALTPAEKAEAMTIFNVDWENYQTYREHFRDYLKAGLSEMEAKEYIRIGKEVRGAVAAATGGGGG